MAFLTFDDMKIFTASLDSQHMTLEQETQEWHPDHRSILSTICLRPFSGKLHYLTQSPEMSLSLSFIFIQRVKLEGNGEYIMKSDLMSSMLVKDSLKFKGLTMAAQHVRSPTYVSCLPLTLDFDDQINLLAMKIKEAVNQQKLALLKQLPDMQQSNQGAIEHEVRDDMPVSIVVAEDNDQNIALSDEAAQLQNTLKRKRTDLVGSIQTSFKLSHESMALGLKVEEKILRNQIGVRRYSLPDRLSGWRLERKQRPNGRFDMYFHHEASNGFFRSVVEVVNFILTETSPKMHKSPGMKRFYRSINRSANKGWQKTPPTFASDGSRSRPEQTSSPMSGIPKAHKEEVERFLAESIENLNSLNSVYLRRTYRDIGDN